MTVEVPQGLRDAVAASKPEEVRELCADVGQCLQRGQSPEHVVQKVVDAGWSRPFSEWLVSRAGIAEGYRIELRMPDESASSFDSGTTPISESEWETLWGGRQQLWATSTIAASAACLATFVAVLLELIFKGDSEGFWGMVLPIGGAALFAWFLAFEIRWVRRKMPKWNAALKRWFPDKVKRDIFDPNIPAPGEVLFRRLVRKYPHLVPGFIAGALILTEIVQSPELPGPERMVGIMETASGLACGAITWYWIRGAHRHPRQSALLGGAAALAAMLPIGFLFGLFFALPFMPLGSLVLGVVVTSLHMGLIGVGGGLALDRMSPTYHVGTRVALGTGVAGFLGWAIFAAAGYPSSLIAALAGAVAWGAALILYKPAAGVFEGKANETQSSSARAKLPFGGPDAARSVVPPHPETAPAAKAQAPRPRAWPSHGYGQSMVKFHDLPEGVHTLMPMLVVHDGKAMLDFYKRAFGAVETMCAFVPDSDKIMHASLRIGDSSFSITDEFTEHGGCVAPIKSGGTAVTIHIQVSEGMDELYRQAIEAGAKSEMEPADMFWGDRFAMVKDPAGHQWSIGMAIPNPPKISDEELKAELGV